MVFRQLILFYQNKVIYQDYYRDKHTGENNKNKMDLEIGDICHFINIHKIKIRSLSVTDKDHIKKYVDLCRDVRNDLSHLSMPIADDINLFIGDYDKIIKLL